MYYQYAEPGGTGDTKQALAIEKNNQVQENSDEVRPVGKSPNTIITFPGRFSWLSLTRVAWFFK